MDGTIKQFDITVDDVALCFFLHDETFSQRRGIILSDAEEKMHIEHSHIYYEMIYAAADNVYFEYSGSKYPLPKNHFTVIKPFELHKTFFRKEDALLSIGFTLKKVRTGTKTEKKFGSLVDLLEHQMRSRTYADEGIRELFDQLHSLSVYSDKFHDGYLISIFLMIFFNMMSTIECFAESGSKSDGEAGESKIPIAELVGREVNMRYTDDVTPQSLSDKYGISPRQINRYFVSQYGETLLQRRTRLRMEAAKRLLVTSESPIKSIYERLGYVSVNTFYSAFRKAFGMTPDVFRKSFGSFK